MRESSLLSCPYGSSFRRFYSLASFPGVFLAVVVFCLCSYFLLDKPIAFYAKESLHAQIVYIAEYITHLGKSTAYYIILFTMFLFFRFIVKNHAWMNASRFLFLAILIPGLLCTVLKVILGRMRPVLLHSEQLYGFTFFKIEAAYLSFPSGHSMLITSLMMGLACIFPRYWKQFIAFAVCVSMSRILVGAHYLSDVVAGIYLSILIVPLLYIKLYIKFFRSKTGEKNEYAQTN